MLLSVSVSVSKSPSNLLFLPFPSSETLETNFTHNAKGGLLIVAFLFCFYTALFKSCQGFLRSYSIINLDPEAPALTTIAKMAPPHTSQEAKSPENEHAATKTCLLDTSDALTPDPGTEDMFKTEKSKFAFSPGQLSKLLNPKSLNAFYALGGIDGIEKGLHTDRNAGLSTDESTVNGEVAFHEVAPKGTPKHGTAGDAIPESNAEAAVHIPPPEDPNPTGIFCDRKKIFRDNRLPDKKTKSLLEIAWTTYNDKVLILLTIAAMISLALGLYQTFGGEHKKGEPKVEWVEGVAIIVAIV